MPWVCPKCERKLKNTNQWHCCVNQDIDNLFENKSMELVFAFDKILAEVMEWEGINVSATLNCIVFVNTQTFLVIKPMQKVLNIKFYLNKPQKHQLIHKIAKYNKRDEHHVRISTFEEVNPLLIKWIRESYELFL